MKIIANTIKELRNEEGYSQEEIAKYLQVSRVTYTRYENDTREIPIELLIKLADFYKVTIDYIVGREK